MATSKFRCKDTYLPRDVAQAIFDGEMSRVELSILFIIRRFTAGKSRKCFASNNYFAKKMNKNSSWIGESINDLVRMGFVKKRHKNGKRYLKLAWDWSRPVTGKPVTGKPAKGGYGNCRNGSTGKPVNIEKTSYREEQTPSRANARRDYVSVDKDDLFTTIQQYFDKLLATKKIISTTTPLKRWYPLAEKFIKKLQSKSRFLEVLRGYTRNFDPANKYMPQAFSMRKFVDPEKFVQIENWLDGLSGKIKPPCDPYKLGPNERY